MTNDWLPIPGYRHWCPQYLWDRFKLEVYERTHRGYPWLTRFANAELVRRLRPTDLGLEFGSGRSTLWFARRVKALTSVEHDAAWYERVREKIARAGLTNVTYLHCPEDREDELAADAAYVRTLERFAPDSLDFCLVDGVYRPACALGVLEKLRPGAMLIVDNINWYLPCGSVAPNSLPTSASPRTPGWAKFAKAARDWPCFWSSDGVTDTAIYTKLLVGPTNSRSGTGY